jgi:hypothetical protein
MSDTPRKRRPRCNFHYKIDETLRPEDRQNYLALVRCPAMRVDDAHAWLLGRGYAVSRSAVARHRRRLLSTDVEHDQALERAEMFARMATGPGAPDFAAGNRLQLQYVVFQYLKKFHDPTPGDIDDGRDVPDEIRLISPEELLTLSKVVAQCVELDWKQQQITKAPQQQNSAGNPSDPPRKRTDEELRQRIDDIMKRRI